MAKTYSGIVSLQFVITWNERNFYEVMFFTTGANWDDIMDEQWIFIFSGSVFIIRQSIYSQKSTTRTVHFVSCCDRIYMEIPFVWYPWIVMRHDCHCGLVRLRSESIFLGIDIHFHATQQSWPLLRQLLDFQQFHTDRFVMIFLLWELMGWLLSYMCLYLFGSNFCICRGH